MENIYPRLYFLIFLQIGAACWNDLSSQNLADRSPSIFGGHRSILSIPIRGPPTFFQFDPAVIAEVICSGSLMTRSDGSFDPTTGLGSPGYIWVHEVSVSSASLLVAGGLECHQK